MYDQKVVKVTRIVIVAGDTALEDTLVAAAARDRSLKLAATFVEGGEALRHLTPETGEVLLVDTDVAGMDGVECVSGLRARLPGLRIVVVSTRSDSETVLETLSAGADGYLLKPTSPEGISGAISELRGGGAPMSWPVARLVVKSFERAVGRATDHRLSRRESEVVAALVRGLAYKQIADELQMSLGTVRTHIRHIYKKLAVNSRTEAVVKFLQGSGATP